MSGKKFRVVCYCRVATRDQIDDGPLEAQSVYLRRYAKDNGLKVIGEVRAYEKGLTMDRPGWHNVLSAQCSESRHQGKGRCHFGDGAGPCVPEPVDGYGDYEGTF